MANTYTQMYVQIVFAMQGRHKLFQTSRETSKLIHQNSSIIKNGF